jgi:hypothetical protein
MVTYHNGDGLIVDTYRKAPKRGFYTYEAYRKVKGKREDNPGYDSAADAEMTQRYADAVKKGKIVAQFTKEVS